MPTCPNGHQSGSDDWCEVCGHRMAGAGAPSGAMPPPPPPPPPAPGYDGYGFPPAGGEPTAQAELCPQCRTPREAMAPFCEECRYNFLTHTATSYTPVAPPQQPGLNLPPGFQSQPQQPPRPPDPYEYQSSRPSQMNRPAEPLIPEHPAPYEPVPGPPPAPGYQQQPPQQRRQQDGDDDWMLPPPVQQTPQPPQQQQYQTPAGWAATIAPDREYFMAMMQRSGPDAAGLNLPAYSPEQHLPLTGNQITIGRRRHSTGESPDIDLSVPPEDPGVSHQHAVLVQQPDGTWAVVDQNSTNGTTVNGAEDPIQPYVPVALKDGDRVHVGAWTTITVRRG
ncbi:FHA domain-containing protein [Streptomyces sp. NPDC051219]|uniref:FHA domain-containing protein n=1 Tax=Streptomyces sp. NPDC051219 TaxID=3155283 RepID=UPI0034428166